jgi:hypothetical protein
MKRKLNYRNSGPSTEGASESAKVFLFALSALHFVAGPPKSWTCMHVTTTITHQSLKHAHLSYRCPVAVGPAGLFVSRGARCLVHSPELELELIQTQMAQKPMLRAEVHLRASKNVKRAEVCERALSLMGMQGVGECGSRLLRTFDSFGL